VFNLITQDGSRGSAAITAGNKADEMGALIGLLSLSLAKNQKTHKQKKKKKKKNQKPHQKQNPKKKPPPNKQPQKPKKPQKKKGPVGPLAQRVNSRGSG